MKNLLKFLPIAMIALSFASCKKDYTCSCTVAGSTSITELNDSKKSDAEAACNLLDVTARLAGGSCTFN